MYNQSNLNADSVFMMQVVLKDEPDIDPNDQNSIVEHLDKVVLFIFNFQTGDDMLLHKD